MSSSKSDKIASLMDSSEIMCTNPSCNDLGQTDDTVGGYHGLCRSCFPQLQWVVLIKIGGKQEVLRGLFATKEDAQKWAVEAIDARIHPYKILEIEVVD